MGNIHKLTKDGITLFPATTTDAVVHPQVRTALTNLINEYNISSLYPTLGNNGSDIYTLLDAINLLSIKLDEKAKVGGIKVIFKDSDNNYQEWRFLGTGLFTDTSQWSREDSWYIDYSEIDDLGDEEFSGDILRKTEQSLSTTEKDQVKKNLDIEIKAEKVTWSNTSNLNLYTTTGIYTIDGYRTVLSDNLPLVDYGPDVRFTAFMMVNNNPSIIGQVITITDNKTNLTKTYTRNYYSSEDTWSDWQNNEGILKLGNITLDVLDSLTAEGNYEGTIENLSTLFPGINKSNFSLIVKNTETTCTQLLYLSQGILVVRDKINNTDLWTSFSEYITKEMLENIYETRILELESKVKTLEETIESLDLESLKNDFCVGAWDPNSLSPESLYTEGNLKFCDEWNIYLLDTTDNRDKTTTPVGRLMRNNLLRFEDGSWAPVVGITEERRAECDGELYIKNNNGDLVKYCEEGEFDADTFYKDYGMYTKLYNLSGSEVNILRPWETTETKYTIGVGRSKSIYLLDNIKGNSGKVWKGIFSNPVIWDGIDVSDYELKPTAFSPGGCAIINEDGKIKLRNFFYLYSGYSYSNGCSGLGGHNIFKNINRTFPTYNINQITTMTYARNNNNNSSNSFPFAEGGYHTINSYLTSYEVFYGTKYFHADNRFTNGICNVTCNSESTWLVNGGLRYKTKGVSEWTYKSWGNNTDCYYLSSNSTLTVMTAGNMMNNYAPKEQCMESQIVASLAQELGIPENTEFEVYGNTYWYLNVPKAKKLEEGRMNVIIYKRIKPEDIEVLDSLGNPKTIELEIILRIGLVNGVNLGGDYLAYWGGGLELVGTNDPNVNIDFTANKGGFPVKIYQELDQENWLYENTTNKANYGIFDFENIYKLLTETTNLAGENYMKTRHSYTPYVSEKGGSNSTGECGYCWAGNNWSYSEATLGQRARIGVRLRSATNAGSIGFRACNSNLSASYTYSAYSACAQARISETL